MRHVAMVLRLREMLQEAGLESWPKVTGVKDIHLMVALEKRISHDAARKVERATARRLVKERPHL